MFDFLLGVVCVGYTLIKENREMKEQAKNAETLAEWEERIKEQFPSKLNNKWG